MCSIYDDMSFVTTDHHHRTRPDGTDSAWEVGAPLRGMLLPFLSLPFQIANAQLERQLSAKTWHGLDVLQPDLSHESPETISNAFGASTASATIVRDDKLW
ncbi:unnamed protein product [Cercospora beticola]|nr:unnamed protein product [Cercospora beticola]